MNNPLLHIPAEWEVDGDILMAWPHEKTDWAYMLNDVRKCYVDIIEAITSAGIRVLLLAPGGDVPELSHIPSDRLICIDYLTNDTWTRDYGPISFVDNLGNFVVADFKFNGWGLKFAADRDNLVSGKLLENAIIKAPCLSNLDFVLEGGGIESNGKGDILTTSECQMSLNRNGGKFNPTLKQELEKRLNGARVLYVDNGYLAGDDTDSHIDTLARFAPGDTILYVGCRNLEDEHFEALNRMKADLEHLRTADDAPFNLIELPFPDPIFDDDGERLPATYANFLVTPRALFLPTYNQPDNDRLAEQVVKKAFGLPVYSVDCTALIRQHGSLHCATMQIPKQIISL